MPALNEGQIFFMALLDSTTVNTVNSFIILTLNMIHHVDLGGTPFSKRRLKSLIKQHEIILAGNKQLKIYGTLQCKSGKRMKIENRVFIASEKEAINLGYRPCGHCLKRKYQKWKNKLIWCMLVLPLKSIFVF